MGNPVVPVQCSFYTCSMFLLYPVAISRISDRIQITRFFTYKCINIQLAALGRAQIRIIHHVDLRNYRKVCKFNTWTKIKSRCNETEENRSARFHHCFIYLGREGGRVRERERESAKPWETAAALEPSSTEHWHWTKVKSRKYDHAVSRNNDKADVGNVSAFNTFCQSLRHGTIRETRFFSSDFSTVLSTNSWVCALYFSDRKCDIRSNACVITFSEQSYQNIYRNLLQ